MEPNQENPSKLPEEEQSQTKTKTKTKKTKASRDPGTCRYYENELPEVGDNVMVRVDKIDKKVAALVSLLEYDNRQGFINLSQLSKIRLRSLRQNIHVGKVEVMQVYTVDKVKGYVDLTKKSLCEEDIEECTVRFNKAKTVHSILSHVASIQQSLSEDHFLTLHQIYSTIGWPLYAKYGHAYDAFQALIKGENVFEGLEIRDQLKDDLTKTIRHRMGSSPTRFQADIHVICFAPAGITGIIPALKAGVHSGTESCPVKCQLVSSPQYALSTCTPDDKAGIQVLNDAISAIKTEITKYGGECSVIKEARMVA